MLHCKYTQELPNFCRLEQPQVLASVQKLDSPFFEASYIMPLSLHTPHPRLSPHIPPSHHFCRFLPMCCPVYVCSERVKVAHEKPEVGVEMGKQKWRYQRCLGGSVGWAANFGSGHDLTAWRLMSSSPESGSVLTVQSLEPALDSVSSSLSAPPSLIHALSLSVSKINIKKFFWRMYFNLALKQNVIKYRERYGNSITT